MTTITATDRIPVRTRRRPSGGQDNLSALLTLARRRLALSASNPREIFVPLLTPLLFALVIAPALATVVRSAPGLDYRTYLAIGTAGLLVPLACMFAGLGVVVDRQSGARRELLTAPIPRGLIVFGNLLVAVLVSGLQLGAWFSAPIWEGRISTRPPQVSAGLSPRPGASPSRCIPSPRSWPTEFRARKSMSVPCRRLRSCPGLSPAPCSRSVRYRPGLTAIAKALPLTHVLALMRYGALDRHGAGLRDIWGMTNTTVMAALSTAVVVAYAILFLGLALRVFRRTAVR